MKKIYFDGRKALLAAMLCLAGMTTVNAQSKAEGNTVFYESFDKLDGRGGNDGYTDNYKEDDGVTEVSIAETDLDETNYAAYLDNGSMTGWALKKVAICNKCVRLGTKKKSGSLTTPAIGLEGNGTLTFNAFAWQKDIVTAYVEITGGGTLQYNGGESATKIAITLPENKKNPAKTALSDCGYTISISGATAASQLVFSCESSDTDKQRFFLDEIKVSSSSSAGIAIHTADSATNNGAIYTISGQRVNASSVKQLAKGLYIIGGRKVMVR